MLTTLVSALAFGEAPRWRDDGLYFVDMHADKILAYRSTGAIDIIATFSGPVSGLGWLPDGRLLVVSMHDRKLLRREFDGSFVEHADLSQIATWHANDMVVAANGDAFVGNFGFPLDPPGPLQLAKLARVSIEGEVSVAAEDLFFPNGSVITPDERTLIVAESGLRRLTAFDLDSDGLLSNRRVWANLPSNCFPDGICLDSEGAIWAASPASREVLRVREGGEVVDQIATEQEAIACMLGGHDRKTLFICTAESTDPARCRQSRTARLLSTPVEVSGAGRP